METLKKIFIILLLIGSYKTKAQLIQWETDYTPPSTQQNKSSYNSWNGYNYQMYDVKYIRPTGTYRSLNILINIIWDQTPLKNPYYNNNNGIWNNATIEGVNNQSIPISSYMTGFFDINYNPNNVVGYMTRLYHESSFGSLVILGDFVVVNIKQSTMTPSNPGSYFNFTSIVQKAVDFINVSGLSTIYGHNQISDYDYNGDNFIDVVNVLFRNPNGYPNGGLNGLDIGQGHSGGFSYHIKMNGTLYAGASGTINGVGDGNISYGCPILTHEIAHQFFGDNSFHTSGGNHYGTVSAASSIGLQGGFGLMGCANSSLTSCNGYERWRMHWKSSIFNTSAYYIAANNVNSDIQQSDGNKTFVIRDFVTTGDAIRIKLPYKDNSNCSNQYIWLENHQVGNNNKLDFFHYSLTESCRKPGTAGIYAYYQIGRDIIESTDNTVVWPEAETDNLKQITPEGNWDMTLMTPSTSYNCVAGPPVRTELLNLENPLMGYNDLQLHFFDASGNTSTLSKSNGDFSWKKYYNQTKYNDSLPYLGDVYDAFTSTKSIGVGTNPATSNLATYYLTQGGGVFSPSNTSKNNTKIYLSGLKITMTDLSNGTFQVSVVWDDYNISNDVRWTGEIVLKEQLNLLQDKTILIDQNYTPYKIYKDNVTGVYASTTKFSCESGSEFTMQPNATVIVDNKSTLRLKTGSKYVIENNADLTIKNGCSLYLDACSKLVINGNGKLIVENGGVLCISDGAILDFENGQQNLDLQNGYLIPIGYINPLDIVQPYNNITSNNEIWTNKNYYIRELTILPNAKLTLQNSKFIFTEELSKLIINTSGKLISDNSILTSDDGCGESKLWQGIELRGTKNASQALDPITHTYAQGIVELKNGAVIENALQAIRTIKINTDGSPDWNTTGGIVKADGATFRNNKNGVWFGPYENKNGNIVQPNISYFTKCTFESDNNYIAPSNPSNEFVGLYGVQGIGFLGCTFQNTATITPPAATGIGINAFDASFAIDEICISGTSPCTSFQKSKFINLNYGISLKGSNVAVANAKINNSVFDNNSKGVFLRSANNCVVTNNTFNVG